MSPQPFLIRLHSEHGSDTAVLRATARCGGAQASCDESTGWSVYDVGACRYQQTASPRSTLLIAHRQTTLPEFRSRNCAHRGRETVLSTEAGLVGYLHQIVSRRRAAQLRLTPPDP